MPQAESVAIPKRLPLVLGPENRGDSTSYDAKLINAYIEKTKEGETWIYERPGMDEHSRPPAATATGRGIFNWRGNIYSIFADRMYKDGVVISGTVDTANGVYRFDSCLGATPKLQLGNGIFAYNYDTAGGLVLINDAQFPAAFVKGWAYLNATTYVMTAAANIQGSDDNDPVNWDALNTITAQIEPDQGKALGKQLVYVVAFKEWSTEVFYDAGNATGSPLGRVEGAKIPYGCLSSDSVRQLDGALIWLGSTKDGSPEVIMLDGLKMEVISSKPVERLLKGATLTNVFSWTIKINGHRFYVLTLKDENLTLACDLDQERRWFQWTDTNGDYLPIVDSTMNASLQNLVQHESNGRIYIMDTAYADDDGDLITVDLVTPNFDGGTRRRKTMGQLKVVCDQQVASVLQVRVNDNDYDPKKWSNWRNLDLSRKEPFIENCGTFTRRIHHFRHRRNVRMPRIQAIEMQIDIGTL